GALPALEDGAADGAGPHVVPLLLAEADVVATAGGAFTAAAQGPLDDGDLEAGRAEEEPGPGEEDGEGEDAEDADPAQQAPAVRGGVVVDGHRLALQGKGDGDVALVAGGADERLELGADEVLVPARHLAAQLERLEAGVAGAVAVAPLGEAGAAGLEGRDDAAGGAGAAETRGARGED
ncbi:hypothetical protein BN1723_015787, partial [Verticillium longisporum]